MALYFQVQDEAQLITACNTVTSIIAKFINDGCDPVKVEYLST